MRCSSRSLRGEDDYGGILCERYDGHDTELRSRSHAVVLEALVRKVDDGKCYGGVLRVDAT